jgi:hypothetical protein
MPEDLPETYYLDNVLTLFEHVRQVYGDLLEQPQLAFLDDFAALSPDASKLCIRLLNRSHDCYRRGKLNYGEIGSLSAAITELAQGGFLEINGDIDRATLLSLFTLAELRALIGDDGGLAGLSKLRRAELEDALLELDDDDFFTRLKHCDDLLQLLCRDEYLLCQMLFFGNLNQSMTDFVLHDLGLFQYEDYPVDPEHRPYRSTLEIQQHWLLYQLQTRFELGDNSDRKQLRELAHIIPGDIEALAPGFGKSERLRYQVARQLERIGDLSSADRLYRQCLLPPSRERRARILDQRGKHRAALDLCEHIIAQPLDEQELQFACGFAARLIRRHDFAAMESIEQLRITHQPPVIDLELEFSDPTGRGPVEIAVADFHNRLDPDGRCDYIENSLFNGVLGLLLWDVVFAPLPGAFYNPFQYRPSDFYAHDFARRRRCLLQQAWFGINSNEDIWQLVRKRWRQKQGLMNPFVNWQGLDLDLIELALERIDHAHWRAIFDRILQDLRNNRAGFPDLVHFPSAGGYCLIEVKGPGDSLQKNQQRWMQHFEEHGIPHQLTRVTWRTN